MFIEPNISGERRGWIEVICGSMFSGKTEELIRRLKRAKIANLKVEIFKPAIDVRYDENNVVSHDSNAIQSTPIDNSQTILLMAEGVDVVGIDEAQFFDDEIIHVCEILALRGVRVIVAGLDMDYLGRPFGQMPYLLSIADYITKLHAICMKCGNIANVSYRKTEQQGQVLLGKKKPMNPAAVNVPMKNNRRILALVQKDLLLETRQQYTLYGILLYVASTIFVVYLSMDQPEEKVWNGLFWVIQLFVCINAVAKSFLQESRGRMLYFYSIAGARDFVLAKLLFNAGLMIVMSLLSLVVFTVLLGNPLENGFQFIFITCLGGMSLSLVFTFLAAIASKAQQQAALMAIMGFPLIIPQLLLLMKISSSAFSSVIQAGWWQMVLLLAGLDLMVVALAVILFPFLWKD